MQVETYGDEFLAYMELSQDLLFHKIERKKLPMYIEQSLRFGSEAASIYKGQDIENLYQDNHIAIEYTKNTGDFYKVKFRAQFEFDKQGNHKVFIYNDSIKKMADTVGIEEEVAKKIHLCHEFFHFHEMMHHRIVSEQIEPVVSMEIMGLKRKANISRCSEVAAHKFAKEMLQLEYLPNYYDYMYLGNEKTIPESYLDEQRTLFHQVIKKE